MNPALVEVITAGLAVIESVFKTMNDAKSGKIAPEDALAQIQAMSDQFAKDDAAAAAAEDAKFGK